MAKVKEERRRVEEEIVLSDEDGNEHRVPYILNFGEKMTQEDLDEMVEEIERERREEEEADLQWLTIYMDGEVFDAAELRAGKEGRTAGDLIREAVERYLEP